MTLTPFIKRIIAQIERIRRADADPEGRTIFHEILSSGIPEPEKKTSRVADEALIFVLAGSETTAVPLTALTYHLLSNPPMLKRLKAELESVMPDPQALPEISKIENLPFLVSYIHGN